MRRLRLSHNVGLAQALQCGLSACSHEVIARFQQDPAWDNLLFFEYFHGDNGAGLGASHQTGWTALVVDLLLDPPIESVPFDLRHASTSS